MQNKGNIIVSLHFKKAYEKLTCYVTK